VSTTTATQTTARPKRRRLQFSLRTMLALTTLVCFWLGCNAWQHEREKAVVAHLESLDREPEAIWSAPAWWRSLFPDSSAGIFDRVQQLTIDADGLSRDNYAGMQFEKLTSLTHLTLVNDDLAGGTNQVIPGISENCEISLALNYSIPWLSEPLEKYQRQPSSKNAKTLRRAIRQCQRDKFVILTEPRELFTFGHTFSVESDECALAQVLEFSDMNLAAVAAETLWKVHSLRHACDVVKFVRQCDPKRRQCHKYFDQVEADLRPDRILAEITTGDRHWGEWLASLSPDAKLTATLIRTVDEGRGTEGTIYALGKANDPQVVATLLKALSDPKLSDDITVRALLPYFDDTLEDQLIAGLADGHCSFVDNAAKVLAQTGSPRCLPALRELNDEWKLLPETLLYRRNVVAAAIARIEARVKKATQQ
jgi:PBS lyase HEAT-like repeat